MRERADESSHEAPAEPEGFSLGGRAKSFGYAFAGIALVIRTQHNAWIHSLASVLVIGLGIFFPLSGLEWCALIFAIAMVWIAEAMNTALESLADAAISHEDPLVGRAKDAAAGAVLLAAIAAAAIGLVVLGPYCLSALGL